MFELVQTIEFCYGHRLLNYAGKCANLHGHNGRAEVVVGAAELNALGMVEDFRRIKLVVKEWVDRELDHRMLLHRDDPLVGPLREHGEPIVTFDGNPTAEAIARRIYEFAVRRLPVVEVRLWETPRACAIYRPAAAHRTRRPDAEGAAGCPAS